MLLVSATAGVVGMTQEHLGIAVALEVPFFIVVTKVGEVPIPSASVHCRYRYSLPSFDKYGIKSLPVPLQ